MSKKNSEEDESSLLPKKILVATDGSENSARASRMAVLTAKRNHATLIVMTAVTITPIVGFPSIGANTYPTGLQGYYQEVEKKAAGIVESVVDAAKKENVDAEGYVERSTSSVVESIIEKASKEKVDLIVIGTRGLGGFKKLVLGSVSSGVVTHARCNVLVVR
jgi:nucleotide-binding universal stress UspA family protein